jgi:hypothetical protein
LAVQIPIGQIVIASGRMWLQAGIQILWAAIFCGGSWAFLTLGALGLVTARLVAYLIHTLITWVIAWQAIKGESQPGVAPRAEGFGNLARPCEDVPEQL